MLIFGCFVQHICFFYYIHFGVTYKPKWAGYYIVNIFILSLNLFVHVTIIKIYNTIHDSFHHHIISVDSLLRPHKQTNTQFGEVVVDINKFHNFIKHS